MTAAGADFGAAGGQALDGVIPAGSAAEAMMDWT